MNEGSAPEGHGDAMPIFGAYRRGYDPDQVDRFVAEQQRRLDETLQRATEAERKLAAAVGQLRELHRRVAVLEADERPPQQPQPLDTLGERVQRILQEAWDGAFALRESVEREVSDQRAKAAEEAKDLVASARRKAQAIEEEIDRRRRAYLERLEEDRARASAQIAHLDEQRAEALASLLRVRDVIDTAAAAVDRPAETSDTLAGHLETDEDLETDERPEAGRGFEERSDGGGPSVEDAPVAMAIEPPAPRGSAPVADDDLPPTMPVHRLDTGRPAPATNDRATLVQSHRESVRFAPAAPARPQPAEQSSGPASEAGAARAHAEAAVFDFEQA